MVEWLTHSCLSKKYFHDEMLVGTSEKLGWAASCLDIIYPQTGLKRKWITMECYALRSEVADLCGHVLPTEVSIHSKMSYNI